MTPLRLRLEEFGPYTGRHEIHFSDFADTQIFLIHGPTGSGKSALLDAVCFALYGETSGAERDGNELRSHHAAADAPTEVTLDFQLGAKTYRVTRRPRMEMPKKRGSGTTTRSEAATLWDRTEASGTEEGAPLADGKTDVDTRVQDLLGFESGQFRQVVMLPQGQFRKFLSANSKERERLLKVLFDTTTYERLQEELKAMAKEVRQTVEQLRHDQGRELERYGVDDVEGLRERLSKARRIHARATERETALSGHLDDARTALETARRNQEKLDERDAARETLDALEADAEAIEAKKAELAAARNAAEVAPRRDNLEVRTEEKNEAEAALREAEEALATARSEHEKAKAALEEEEARSDERKALQTRVNDLERRREDVDALENLNEKVEQAEAEFSEAKAARDETESALETISGTLETLREKHETASEEAQEVSARASAVETARTRLTRAEEVDARRAKLETARSARADAESAHEAAVEAYDAAVAKRDRLRQKRMDGYAAVLAHDLEAGDACPVCGATEHPSPARHNDDIPDAAAIEAADEEVADRQAEVDATREALHDARARVERLTSEIDDRLSQDPELEDTSTEALSDALDEATDALKSANDAKADAESLKEEIEAAESERQDLNATLESQTEAVQAAKEAVVKWTTERDSVRKKLPDGMTTVADLTEALEDARERLGARTEALEAARESAQEAQTAVAQAETAVKGAKTALETAVDKRTSAEDAFQDALAEAGFESADAFASAFRPKDERDALQSEIDDFEQRRSAARDRLARAREAAAGLSAPDVDGAAARVERLERAVAVQQKRTVQLESHVGDVEATLEELGDLADQLAAADARYGVVGTMADAATGSNDHNMNLQRFVLARRLEDVLRVANGHFRRMSQNRYTLRRATEVRDGRSAAGLDLIVDDAHTGQQRSVSTLSGGEGFQASLALALGMSDVVQSVSGGRHLETIFIDEGFGSLDADALDRAMQSLTDLRSNGRLVGIISHVAELKKRIPACVEVQPTQTGSSLTVSV